MSTRAHVGVDYLRFEGVAIYIVDELPDGTRAVLHPTELVMEPVTDEGVAIQEPSIRMPESMARALLDALSAHFGGTSDMQTLRTDYLAERDRVDRMINHMIGRPA